MKLTTSLLCLALLTLCPAALSHAQGPSPAQAPRPELHTYRLMYTLTEMVAGKKVGLERYSMVVTSCTQRATIKLGSKMPVNSGIQYTYIDVGLNISATLTEYSNGVQVSTDLEQSSIEDAPKSDTMPHVPPIVRQAELRITVVPQSGKPIQIGSLDIPGSTHHLDVQLLLEKIS